MDALKKSWPHYFTGMVPLQRSASRPSFQLWDLNLPEIDRGLLPTWNPRDLTFCFFFFTSQRKLKVWQLKRADVDLLKEVESKQRDSTVT